MRHPLIELAEKSFLKTDLPEINIGDQVIVSVKVVEGTKTRIQKYEGLVIAKNSTGLTKTITVRKIASGIGVERVFMIHSPLLENIEIKATGAKVRRAKLYYMRGLRGKKARIKYKSAK